MISSIDFHIDAETKMSHKVFKNNMGAVDFTTLHVGEMCFYAQDAIELLKLGIAATAAGNEFMEAQQLYDGEVK